MRIKALKTLRGTYGFLRRGDETDVDDATARKLIASKYAEEVVVKAEAKPKAEPKPEPTAGDDEKTKRKPKGKSDADTDS